MYLGVFLETWNGVDVCIKRKPLNSANLIQNTSLYNSTNRIEVTSLFFAAYNRKHEGGYFYDMKPILQIWVVENNYNAPGTIILKLFKCLY